MNVVTGEVPETYTNDGLMVFPTWRTNSIVYASELISRIPSEMTAAIAYGNNLSSLERGAEDSAADRRGKAIGKLFAVETEDKLLKAAEKLDNAYIVNVYEKDVKDLNELQYTHIQILGHKNWQNKNAVEDHKSSLWKSLARIFEGK